LTRQGSGPESNLEEPTSFFIQFGRVSYLLM
jgi:hypothetical protein